MAVIELSLSRAHKVAERLKSASKEAFGEAISLAAPQTIRGVAGKAHVERLQAQEARAMALMNRAELLSQALVSVRTRIGQENETRGISGMLAELEGLNRLISQRKELLAYAKEDSLSIAELSDYRQFGTGESPSPYGVQVRMLSDAARSQLEEAIAVAQREAYALSDRIAEANARRMSLELDDAIAQEVTGMN